MAVAATEHLAHQSGSKLFAARSNPSVRSEADGGAALEISLAFPAGPRVTQVSAPFAVFGSSPAADVMLPDGTAARSLLLLASANRALYARLVASESDHVGWIESGETIHVEGHEVRVNLGSSCGFPLQDASWAIDGPFPPVRVVFRHAGRVLAERRLTNRLSIIGRKRPSAIRIRHPELSGCHCALLWSDDKLWVIDLASTQGTILNGQRVKSAELHVGASLHLAGIDVEVAQIGEQRAQSRIINAETSAANSASGSRHLDSCDSIVADRESLLSQIDAAERQSMHVTSTTIDEFEDRIRDVEGEAALRRQLETAKQEQLRLKTELAVLRRESSSELDSVAREREELAASLSVIAAEKSRLVQDHEQARQAAASLRDQLARLQEQSGALHETIAALRTDLDQHRLQAERESHELQEQQQRSLTQLQVREQRIELLEGEIRRLCASQPRDNSHELERQSQSLRQSLEHARAELQQQRADQFQELAAQQANLRKAVEEEKTRQVQEAAERSMRLEVQLESLKMEHASLAREREQLRIEREQFEELLASDQPLSESSDERRLQQHEHPSSGNAEDGSASASECESLARSSTEAFNETTLPVELSTRPTYTADTPAVDVASRVMQRMVQRDFEPPSFRRVALWAGILATLVGLLSLAVPYAWPLLAGG